MVYPYMIDRGEKGSSAQYFDFDHARERILAKEPEEAARLSGVSFDADKSEFRMKCFGQDITVSYPECRARFTETGETPRLEWHLAILHYLAIADGTPLSDKWAPIKEIIMAHPQTFESQTNNELVKAMGDKPLADIQAAAAAIGADIQQGSADLNMVFYPLPRFPMLIQLWLNEGPIPGSGNVLFDARGGHYLHEEDIFFAGLLFVEFVISQYKHMFP